jgi:D-tagatose-1,6-bisphosphate aldolase subunit GatZ/KbaZ
MRRSGLAAAPRALVEHEIARLLARYARACTRNTAAPVGSAATIC